MLIVNLNSETAQFSFTCCLRLAKKHTEGLLHLQKISKELLFLEKNYVKFNDFATLKNIDSFLLCSLLLDYFMLPSPGDGMFPRARVLSLC